MSFAKLTLGHQWCADEWPEYVEVDHNGGMGDGPRRYVPESTCRVVRVVRCRDCVFTEEEGRFCNFFTDESGEISIPASVEPDGFCAWGKPREGDS